MPQQFLNCFHAQFMVKPVCMYDSCMSNVKHGVQVSMPASQDAHTAPLVAISGQKTAKTQEDSREGRRGEESWGRKNCNCHHKQEPSVSFV